MEVEVEAEEVVVEEEVEEVVVVMGEAVKAPGV